MYLTLKALHIIFVVTWFAGLFYIFRLFVYHRAQANKQEIAELFSIMERRLLYYITIPSSIAVTVLGLSLIWNNPSLIHQRWLQWKLLCVIGLFAYQFLAVKIHKEFKKKNFLITEKTCRLINEVPTIFLFLIIFLAVKK